MAQVHDDQGRPLVKIEEGCEIFYTGEPGTLYTHTGGSFTETASLTHDFRRFEDLAQVFTRSFGSVNAGSPVGKILYAMNMGAIFDRFGVWSERGARKVEQMDRDVLRSFCAEQGYYSEEELRKDQHACELDKIEASV